jgi:hypothetical protein
MREVKCVHVLQQHGTSDMRLVVFAFASSCRCTVSCRCKQQIHFDNDNDILSAV